MHVSASNKWAAPWTIWAVRQPNAQVWSSHVALLIAWYPLKNLSVPDVRQFSAFCPLLLKLLVNFFHKSTWMPLRCVNLRISTFLIQPQKDNQVFFKDESAGIRYGTRLRCEVYLSNHHTHFWSFLSFFSSYLRLWLFICDFVKHSTRVWTTP